MKRDDLDFMERITLDLQTRRAGCSILEVKGSVSRKDFKSVFKSFLNPCIIEIVNLTI